MEPGTELLTLDEQQWKSAAPACGPGNATAARRGNGKLVAKFNATRTRAGFYEFMLSAKGGSLGPYIVPQLRCDWRLRIAAGDPVNIKRASSPQWALLLDPIIVLAQVLDAGGNVIDGDEADWGVTMDGTCDRRTGAGAKPVRCFASLVDDLASYITGKNVSAYGEGISSFFDWDGAEDLCSSRYRDLQRCRDLSDEHERGTGLYNSPKGCKDLYDNCTQQRETYAKNRVYTKRGLLEQVWDGQDYKARGGDSIWRPAVLNRRRLLASQDAHSLSTP